MAIKPITGVCVVIGWIGTPEPLLMTRTQMLKRQLVLDLSVALGKSPSFSWPVGCDQIFLRVSKAAQLHGRTWLIAISGLGVAGGYGWWYGM